MVEATIPRKIRSIISPERKFMSTMITLSINM